MLCAVTLFGKREIAVDAEEEDFDEETGEVRAHVLTTTYPQAPGSAYICSLMAARHQVRHAAVEAADEQLATVTVGDQDIQVKIVLLFRCHILRGNRASVTPGPAALVDKIQVCFVQWHTEYGLRLPTMETVQGIMRVE